MFYKVLIHETGCNKPGEEQTTFNVIKEYFKDIAEVTNYLVERYKPIHNKVIEFKKLKPVFVDNKKGEPEQVGYLYSFWNKDYSHNSKHWFQTDWIEVLEVEEKPVLLH